MSRGSALVEVLESILSLLDSHIVSGPEAQRPGPRPACVRDVYASSVTSKEFFVGKLRD